MIRQYNNRTVQVENGVTKYLADIFCNSTDTKPTANLVNGSKLTEVDTGKTFLYDEADTEWVEYSAGGGGGGIMCITFTNIIPTSETSFTATPDKTFNEVCAAFEAGKICYLNGAIPNMGHFQGVFYMLAYLEGEPYTFISINNIIFDGSPALLRVQYDHSNQIYFSVD